MTRFDSYEKYLESRTLDQLKDIAIRITSVDEMVFRCLANYLRRQDEYKRKIYPMLNYIDFLLIGSMQYLNSEFLNTFSSVDIIDEFENLLSWCLGHKAADKFWDKTEKEVV